MRPSSRLFLLAAFAGLVLVTFELIAIARLTTGANAPQKLMVVDTVSKNGPAPVTMASPSAPVVQVSAILPEPTAVEVIEEPAVVPASVQMTTEPTVDPDVITFNGRPLRYVRTMKMVVTAYSPDERSCGKSADNITASGFSVWTNGMKLVAADTSVLPFKSILTIPGYNGNRPVPVLDRGGKIKGNRLDVLYPTHEIAVKWGKQTLDVDVWEYAD